MSEQSKKLDSKIPTGPVQEKWDKHRFENKLINPSNKRKFSVLIFIGKNKLIARNRDLN